MGRPIRPSPMNPTRAISPSPSIQPTVEPISLLAAGAERKKETMTRLFRSILFVPGTRPDRFGKAEAAGADAVVFDLEDSVEAVRKDDARQAIASWLAEAAPSPVGRIVRINGANTSYFDEDVHFLGNVAPFDAVMLPKVEEPWIIEHVAKAVASRTVIPLIETARAVFNALAIGSAKATVPALVFGGEDLTAQIGATRTVDGEELSFARAQVVLAATAIGADAIDGVLTDIHEPDLLRTDARRARALGYRGKLAIHPSQVPIINEVFSPTAEQIAQAKRIVDAYDDAAARGEGVIRLDNQMIDMPVVTRARRVLETARRIAGRGLT